MNNEFYIGWIILRGVSGEPIEYITEEWAFVQAELFGSFENLKYLQTLHKSDIREFWAAKKGQWTLDMLPLRERRLYFSEQELTEIPQKVIEWSSVLNVLHLSGNQLTRLSSEIGLCQNLTMLFINHNQLTTLPSEIGKLGKLTKLHVGGNRLTTLPSELGLCQNLKELDVSHNQLTKLPSEIGLCQNLKNFYVSHNELTTLPSEIGWCSKLADFYFSNNQLTTLPPEIGFLSALLNISHDGNPWEKPEMFVGSIKEILASFRPKHGQQAMLLINNFFTLLLGKADTFE
jgi:Leucine-rich repeat (LRR) protein